MTNLQQSSFHDLLPPNLKNAETRSISYAADRQFEKLAAKILKTLIYADIMTIDEWLCDFLALIFNIRVYDTAFPLNTKRRLIQAARRNSSRKGTAKAVSDIVGTIHSGAQVEAWFQYSGDPYCFRITVDTTDTGIDDEAYDKLLYYIDDYKALRSHLDGITVNLQSKCVTVIAGAAITGDYAVIVPPVPKGKTESKTAIGGATLAGTIAVLHPGIQDVCKAVFAPAVPAACIAGDICVLFPPPPLKTAIRLSAGFTGAVVAGERVIIKPKEDL